MRLGVGPDEIIHLESNAEAAAVAAGALPGIRREAEHAVGLTAPPVRVILTSEPPPLSQYLRPYPSYAAKVAAVVAVLTLAAYTLAWVATLNRGFVIVALAVAVLLLAVDGKARGRGAVPALTGALFATTVAAPIAFPASIALVLAGALWMGRRRVHRVWPFAGGLAFAAGQTVRPAILLHWPTPPAPAITKRLTYDLTTPEAALHHFLAHEYAHVLLHVRGSRRPPAWFDEGFAAWLAEQLAGAPRWRPESRECVSEPEPARAPRASSAGQDWYCRLMARYYWEVRTLAKALLASVLRRRSRPSRPRTSRSVSHLPAEGGLAARPREQPLQEQGARA